MTECPWCGGPLEMRPKGKRVYYYDKPISWENGIVTAPPEIAGRTLVSIYRMAAEQLPLYAPNPIPFLSEWVSA